MEGPLGFWRLVMALGKSHIQTRSATGAGWFPCSGTGAPPSGTPSENATARKPRCEAGVTSAIERVESAPWVRRAQTAERPDEARGRDGANAAEDVAGAAAAVVPHIATVIAAFSIVLDEQARKQRCVASLDLEDTKIFGVPSRLPARPTNDKMAAKLAIIWIHGLGDRGSSWRGLEDDAQLPGVKAK